MLISSSNDAAFAIASTLRSETKPTDKEFVKLMNQKANQLNLEATYFRNATGLDISETTAGAYGSCRDVTKLINYLLQEHPDLAETTTLASLRLKEREFQNTNKLLSKLPLLLAGKTGFDDLAGGNLTLIVNKGFNHPITITVLGSSIDGRFKDVETLYNYFVK
jgi:D-alanyl-D-alanine carboxypeptidase (penicillin-binding protein 5/6)